MTEPTCTDVVAKLDDLVDGELDPDSTTAVERHMEDCSECRAELQRARDLARAARSLPRRIEPEHDLWPGIRERIAARRVVTGRFDRRLSGAPSRLWTAAAAAAVLIVSVTAAYLIGVERGRPTPGPVSGGASSVIQARSTAVDTELEAAVDELRARLDARRDELSHETWSVVTDNLRIIEGAIDSIELALSEHPNDERLNLRLALAYRQQIDLLRRATTLPAEI
jgi:anti-sigma factor RsiW